MLQALIKKKKKKKIGQNGNFCHTDCLPVSCYSYILEKVERIVIITTMKMLFSLHSPSQPYWQMDGNCTSTWPIMSRPQNIDHSC